MSDNQDTKLSSVLLFAGLNKSELADLWTLGEVVTVRPHCHVAIEGEYKRSLFILLHGRLAVYCNDTESPGLHRVAMLESGAHFGELSLLDNAPRPTTVVAEVYSQLFELSGERFQRWLSTSPPDMRLRFYQACAEDLARRYRRVNTDYLTAQQQLWKHAVRRVGV